MNAKEARQVSIESKVIMEKINEAAFNGLDKITIDTLSVIVAQGLKNLGYGVTTKSSGMNEYVYEISW